MKFTKIRLIGLVAIDLPVINARPSDPYILKGSDGLGPPEVDVSLADTLNAAGSIYQGRRPQSREAVFLVGLNPDHGVGQTASEMRSSLYGMLTPGASDIVRIELLDSDTVVATAEGYVKRVEIAPFSQTPEVQITMACIHPYLQAPNVLYVSPGGTLDLPEVVNEGTAPTGFHMEVIFNSARSGWTLTLDNGKKLEIEYDFVAGDKLVIDTQPGSRGVWLVQNPITPVTTNILYALKAGSTWIMLHGGANIFTTSTQDFEWGDVYFRPQYWGI